MASPNIVNLDDILAPIAEDSPGGEDARTDSSPSSLYQTIKTARSAARAAERNSVHDESSNEADGHWRTISETAPKILREQTKDLEVASWFAESMVRLHGSQGLRDSFLILHGLVERYWDNLYPMPDEDGLETRVASIAGLNGEGAEGVIIAPIRKITITEGKTQGPFSLWQYQQALEANKITDDKVRQAKIDTLGFSLDGVETAVRESSNAFFIDLRDDLSDCISLYKKLGQLLDEHCGAYNAPPVRTVVEVLEECLGAVNHLGRDKFPVELVANESAEDSESLAGENNPVTAGGGPINSRESAFRQLEEIARYFRQTEPHSPVSYVLEKAVKWGAMPLNELMSELIPDDSSRNHYSKLTGVSTNDE